MARKTRPVAKPKVDPLIEALPAVAPKPWVNYVSDAALIISRTKARDAGLIVNPYAGTIPAPPPGVIPKGSRIARLAQDSQVVLASAWASQQLFNNAFFNGVAFLGYPYLSELAQISEYRKPTEVIATEMTREWIEFKSTSSDKKHKADRIKQLAQETTRLDVQGAFNKAATHDSFFGRAHLYLDTGDGNDPAELKTSIGNGRDRVTMLKFKGKTGFLKRIQAVEPVWCYPARYNANDPLAPDWYSPQSWFALGKELHVTRLLTFVGREVPDLLKPSYSFGGLSLSQMLKPYVDNWLRTRQSVSDLIYSFSVSGLLTDMDASTTQGGLEMFKRAELLSNVKNNAGVLMLAKEKEEWFNISVPLSSLDHLQAQAQEHMSAVTSIPLVKLLGITPSGLNASSEGEIQVWYEWVRAYQEKFFTKHLTTVIDLIQLSLWGEIDPDIVFEYKPLRSLSAKELADLQKTTADTHAVYMGANAVAPEEVREALSSDPDSPYDGLDAEMVEGNEEDEEGLDDPAPQLDTSAGQLAASSATLTPREQRLIRRDPKQRRDPARLEDRRDDRRAPRGGTR